MKYSKFSTLALATIALTFLAFSQNGPETVLRPTKQFSKRVVTSGMAGPWEMTLGPDDQLWVTERTAKRVTRVNTKTGERKVAITIDEVSAPGGQDGLLGMALDPDLGKGKGRDYVYVAYTYVDKQHAPHADVADPNSPYLYLYGKIVRLTYTKATGKLESPMDVITGLPAGNDHNGGRLKFGPDQKLYFSIGDQGNNQLGNFCRPIQAQRLPTAKEVAEKNYIAYVGKTLRLNLDGTVPSDNAKLDGVVSHVNTYGHRNPQGLDFGPDGTLYESEQGPKSDDEVNVLKHGGNYGWPHVAGMKDNKGYEYARWAEAATPCSQLQFSDLKIDPSVPREPESAFTKPFFEPIATMFTVPGDYNFSDPVCKGIDFICWPTVAASSIEFYTNKGKGIPGWDKVLFVTTLKRGSLYVLPLTANGKAAAGYFSRYFQSENRYRDTAVSRDGKTIYIATDPGGMSEKLGGGTVQRAENPGAILAFTYTGEGSAVAAPVVVSKMETPELDATAISNGVAPTFTAAQAAAGKTAYNANCAVCHGSNMTNGTFGTPLAGEYFRKTWTGRGVGAFYDKARKTMPPASAGSLAADTYANIVAYVFELNGFQAGRAALPAGGDALNGMTIK